jgi:hypothetical protein
LGTPYPTNLPKEENMEHASKLIETKKDGLAYTLEFQTGVSDLIFFEVQNLDAIAGLLTAVGKGELTEGVGDLGALLFTISGRLSAIADDLAKEVA